MSRNRGLSGSVWRVSEWMDLDYFCLWGFVAAL